MNKILILLAALTLISCKSNKVDVLLVIDNSGSMASTQDMLAKHSNKILDELIHNNIDFQIAVITTDLHHTSNLSPEILTTSTPNLRNKFYAYSMPGTNGNAVEKSMKSMQVALDTLSVRNFIRKNSFLKVIIIGDEDDQSDSKTNSTKTKDVDQYFEYLKIATKTKRNLKFSFSAISIFDDTCNTGNLRQPAERLLKLVTMSNGRALNICDDLSVNLNEIAMTTVDNINRLNSDEVSE